MKSYLLGICFLASIGTTCFDAYCRPLFGRDGRFHFNVADRDNDDTYQQIIQYMERAGYFGYKNTNSNIPNENTYEFNGNYYIDRVYTKISRPGFVWNEQQMQYNYQNDVSNIPIHDSHAKNKWFALTHIKTILQAFNNEEFVKEQNIQRASKDDHNNNYLIYRSDCSVTINGTQLPCKMRLQVDNQNRTIHNIYVDFSQNQLQQNDHQRYTFWCKRSDLQFVDVKRNLWKKDSNKQFLRDIIINNKLLNDENLVQHIVYHGHIGEHITRQIDNATGFLYSITTSGELIKLDTASNRVYSPTVPRGRFIFNNKRQYNDVQSMIVDAHKMLKCIYDNLNNINFSIVSCTQSRENSLEVIIKFDKPIENTSVMYANEINENRENITVCFYLGYHGGYYSINSMFPVKGKSDLWNNEEPGVIYMYTGSLPSDAKTAIRYLSYDDNESCKMYFRKVIKDYAKFLDFNIDDIESINCTTGKSIKDIDVEVVLHNRTTHFLRFVYDGKSQKLILQKIYYQQTKENVWRSEG